jgi:hypothetical protein
MLRTALKQARLVDLNATDNAALSHQDHIFLVSALKQTGLVPLMDHILTLRQALPARDDDTFYLKKLIAREYGEFGLGVMQALDERQLKLLPSFEAKYAHVRDRIRKHIT